jgi:hypothetical protein
MRIITVLIIFLFSCQKTDNEIITAYRITKNISYNNVSVDVVIDKPENNEVDVLLVYHGTVLFDNKIREAANTTLENFKRILNRKDMMIVSVAYPEENLLFGDNILQSEAALLWVKNQANDSQKNILGRTFTRWLFGYKTQYHA